MNIGRRNIGQIIPRLNKLIEIVKNKMKGGKLILFYYYHYYLHQLYKSNWYQTLYSKWSGRSIAQKDHQTLCIPYIYEGKEYQVWVPFERKLVSKMLNQSLHVLEENSNDPKILRQQPGIPYLITPAHLGADSGILISLSTQKQISKNDKITA